MTHLARKLTFWNYFALGFGTMVGTGWIVLMDDWLGRGGPLGAMLGFAIGGVLLLPVGYVYGQWVARLPDAAGEAAYTAQVFAPGVSYFTGWMMLLAYFIVCPWEAVVVGKLAAYIFPGLNTLEMYRVAGQPVFLPRLVVGVMLTIILAYINYRGVRASGILQSWATSGVLLAAILLLLVSARSGAISNLKPLFGHAPFASILLTLQIVPYFVTGFESSPKTAEEAHPGFLPQDFFKAIVTALVVGVGFYVLVIAAVAYITPWPGLLGQRFATVLAFQNATHSLGLARLILLVTLAGLLQIFNGNFVASTRLLYAFGRRGTIPAAFASLHPQFFTPTVAIVGISAATIVGLAVGDALLVPVTEVGSMAAALGWLAACASFLAVEKIRRMRVIACVGALVSLLLVLMKLLPIVPGHFSAAEWIALTAWIVLGLVFHRLARPEKSANGTSV
jgi:basic amino acid/polyamine antiporter, APA family